MWLSILIDDFQIYLEAGPGYVFYRHIEIESALIFDELPY